MDRGCRARKRGNRVHVDLENNRARTQSKILTKELTKFRQERPKLT